MEEMYFENLNKDQLLTVLLVHGNELLPRTSVLHFVVGLTGQGFGSRGPWGGFCKKNLEAAPF